MNGELIMDNRSFLRIGLFLVVPVLLLLLARALNVVNFSLSDYVIAYVLLAGAGLAYELVRGKAENIVSWIFGVIAFAIGIINTFWGNDPLFGIFVLVCSFVFFPPLNELFKKWIGFAIPRIVKVLLGLFIIWAAIGVGELYYKINLMIKSFSA